MNVSPVDNDQAAKPSLTERGEALLAGGRTLGDLPLMQRADAAQALLQGLAKLVLDMAYQVEAHTPYRDER